MINLHGDEFRLQALTRSCLAIFSSSCSVIVLALPMAGKPYLERRGGIREKAPKALGLTTENGICNGALSEA